MGAELGRVGHLQIGVDRPQAFGIDFDPDVGAGRLTDQCVKHGSHRTSILSADIVVGARGRVDGHEHMIGAHGVADVSPGAQRIEIADLHHRRQFIAFDHRDLLGESRLGEDVAPARASVSEHTRRHDAHVVSFGIVTAYKIRADFRDRIGRRGVKRAFLVDRQFLARNATEHL
jgi:hypothetical protein